MPTIEERARDMLNATHREYGRGGSPVWTKGDKRQSDYIVEAFCRALEAHDATLAEFERDLIRERTMAGLAAARARGRKGGRKFALSKAQVRLAQAAMAERDTSVAVLCKELGIERVTLYRYVGPKGELRDYGKRVLGLA